MKKQFITFFFVFFVLNLYGQSSIDSLIQKGIKYHDNQQYTEAIETYKLAFEIDPKSALVNYEMAMTYMYAKEYKLSIKHSNYVIKKNKDYILDAYNAKGACLDYMGKSSKAIKTYKKALKTFSSNSLLNYNLGVTYYNIENYKEADQYLLRAIELNPKHSKSHLFLGLSNYCQNRRVKSMLSLYYFLFLDADSRFAPQALSMLDKQRASCVTVDSIGNTININTSDHVIDSSYGTADMLLGLIEASKNIKAKNDTIAKRLFSEETKLFFQTLGELKKENSEGLWWNVYAPFFYKLSQTENFEAFWHYIRSSESDENIEWLKKNEGKFNCFVSWGRNNIIGKE